MSHDRPELFPERENFSRLVYERQTPNSVQVEFVDILIFFPCSFIQKVMIVIKNVRSYWFTTSRGDSVQKLIFFLLS